MKDKVEEIVFEVLEEIKEDKVGDFKVSRDLKLMGKDGVLDSIDLVNMTVEVEGKLEDELNLSITLASEKAFSRKKSPFESVQSLIEFILELKEEQ